MHRKQKQIRFISPRRFNVCLHVYKKDDWFIILPQKSMFFSQCTLNKYKLWSVNTPITLPYWHAVCIVRINKQIPPPPLKVTSAEVESISLCGAPFRRLSICKTDVECNGVLVRVCCVISKLFTGVIFKMDVPIWRCLLLLCFASK